MQITPQNRILRNQSVPRTKGVYEGFQNQSSYMVNRFLATFGQARPSSFFSILYRTDVLSLIGQTIIDSDHAESRVVGR
jgi:hypothetical protein